MPLRRKTELKKLRDRKYFTLGLTLFLVITACAAILVCLLNYTTLAASVKSFLHSISSLFYGLAFAYLLNPAMVYFEKKLIPIFRDSKKPVYKDPQRTARNTAIVITMLLALLVVYTFFSLILPQLGESITTIATNIRTYFDNFQAWMSKLVEDYPEIAAPLESAVTKVSENFENWLSNDFLPWLSNDFFSFFTSLTSGVVSVVYEVLYVVIGLIISIYVLSGKDKFISVSKKMVYSLFSTERANHVLYVGRYAHDVFGKFIIGKIIDSAIIGVICFVMMNILKLPYPLLISVVVGVTNVIPFFGPFLGAIPSTIFILVVNPIQALYFVIFIVCLQQLDGNFIGPRILGDATGVSGFWVVVSILVFGSLFGFLGMIIAVPTFAVISMLITSRVNSKLENKGISPDADFLDLDHIDPENNALVHFDQNQGAEN